MNAYARRYGYRSDVIGCQGSEPECERRFRNFFFRKHCVVNKFLQKNTTQGDAVFVSDSSIVPYRLQSSLDRWLNLTKFEDLAFYDRKMNPEVAAGNYMVRRVMLTPGMERGVSCCALTREDLTSVIIFAYPLIL